MILYILHFQDTQIIKIGVSTSIYKRIKQIETTFNLKVDFHKSMIIANPRRKRIQCLERFLLDMTYSFKYKFDITRKRSGGQHEFRKNNCTNLILQYIKDQRDYGFHYKIYTGIDVAGKPNTKIPRAYNPVDIPAKGVCRVIQKDIEKYCKEHNLCTYEFIEVTFYEKFKALKIDRTDDRDYSNYYKPPESDT